MLLKTVLVQLLHHIPEHLTRNIYRLLDVLNNHVKGGEMPLLHTSQNTGTEQLGTLTC